MMITKLRRSTKGLSPIFATLILIAIAVIAGIVVYMFTSGTIASMTGGGTAGQEKVAVQSASYSGTTVTVLASSTGGPLPTANGLIIKDAVGNVKTTITTLGGTGFTATGALDTFTGTASLTTGTYTATLTTKAGGSFVSSSFTVP